MSLSILHVISAPAAGGAEVYAKDLCKGLVKKGYKVFIGFLERAKDIGRCELFEKEYLKELDNNDVAYFFIGNECRKKPWLGMARVSRFIAENKIDVYHSHLPFGVVFGFTLNIPAVYSHHSSRPRISRLTFKIFNYFIDRYIGISAFCAERLASFTGRDVTEIPNGIDTGKIPAKVRRLNAGTVIRGIAVGRIHPDKDYCFLIDAVQSLPKSYRDRIQITIVGEGQAEYEAGVKKHALNYGVENCFEFLGNRSDMAELLSGADFFLMSSLQEGLPIALIEAAASGLPCIVTDVGGCREIIDLCGNGYAVPHGDIPAYASAICDVLSDAVNFETLSENAVAQRNLMDISHATRRHIDVYNELVKAQF